MTRALCHVPLTTAGMASTSIPPPLRRTGPPLDLVLLSLGFLGWVALVAWSLAWDGQ